MGSNCRQLGVEHLSRQRGRPSRFRLDVRRRIIESLRRGTPLKVAARDAGVSYYTVNGWLRRGEDMRGVAYRRFAKACQLAITKARVARVEQVWAARRARTVEPKKRMVPPARRTVSRTSADGALLTPIDRRRFHELLDLAYVLIHDPPPIAKQRKLLDSFLDQLRGTFAPMATDRSQGRHGAARPRADEEQRGATLPI